MKTIQTLLLALALPTGAFSEEKEQAIKFGQLPENVASAIKKASGGARLKHVSRETEDGRTAYEASWDVKGRTHEITVASDGSVLANEQVISLSDAPKAVRAAIEKAAAGGKVLKVEKVSEKKATLYEAVIATAKTHVEIEFDSKGKELKRETGAEKD